MKAFILAILFGLAIQTPQDLQQGSIQGVVTKAGTNEPLSGVQIVAGKGYIPPVSNSRFQFPSILPVANAVVNTVTDEAGRFSIPSLSPGTYTVRADRDGYWGLVEENVSAPSISKEVQLDAQNPRALVALSLIAGGLITGQVEMPNGEPAAKFAVSAYRVSYMNGRRVLTTSFTQESDDRGKYRLFSLPPGEYYIGAGPASRSPLAALPTVSTTYFPTATDARLAQTVNVIPGAEIGGINISMQSLPAVTVSGQLVDPDSKPINGGFNFILISRDESVFVENIEAGIRNLATETDKAQFELRGVEPGSYRLYVRLVGSTLGGFAEIEVPPRGLRDVVVTIRPAVEVRGRVLLNDISLSPVAAAPVSATVAGTTFRLPEPAPNISLRAVDSTTISRSYQTTIDASGAFVFSGVAPGIYQIQGPQGAIGPTFAGLPVDAYVADVREQGSIFNSGITIDGRRPEEIRVFVKQDGTTVDGSVVDAQNRPVQRAGVVLVPDASYRGNDLRYRTGPADAAGHFSIVNVPPGHYKAFASTAGISAYARFRSSSYIQRVEDLGISFSVGSGEKKTIQLKVIPQ